MMRLLQGYYDDVSRSHLDQAAEPFDVGPYLSDPLYEYAVFRAMRQKGFMKDVPVGIVSWKFRFKAQLPPAAFLEFARAAFAQGAEVVFLNPMTAAEALYGNVWEQAVHGGFTSHNNMSEIIGALFSKSQFDQMSLMPKSAFALCNYFIGGPAFWPRYLAFCEEMLGKIEALKSENPRVYALINSEANYHRSAIADLRPAIFERLFSAFLMLNPDIRRVNFQYAPAAYEAKFTPELGRYLHALAALKDNVIHSRDASRLEKWKESRAPLLKATQDMNAKDDIQPPGEFYREAGSITSVKLKEIESSFREMEARGECNSLFTTMFNLSCQLSLFDGLMGYALFLPQFDKRLRGMAEHIVPKPAPSPVGKTMVYVATEVYETGGHARVIEDMVHALPEYRHVLVLTDVMENYRNGRLGLGILEERFAGMKLEVVCLQEPTLSRKTCELASGIAGLAPQAVAIFGHHYDVIAHAGISAASAPRVLYVHHCDHNPALGGTRADFIHLDVNPLCLEPCGSIPGVKPSFLGLSMTDRGLVKLPETDELVGVTCATAYKYIGRCEFSYGELVASLFAEGVVRLYHIGAMPPLQGENIKAEIRGKGQDPERLVFVPNIPSLAEGLKEIAPSFFLCSYPEGGGKTMIEAMSVGLPLIFPRAASTRPLICADMNMGASLSLTRLDEVSGVLARLRVEKKELGRRSREVFDKHYSLPIFRQKLLDVIS